MDLFGIGRTVGVRRRINIGIDHTAPREQAANALARGDGAAPAPAARRGTTAPAAPTEVQISRAVQLTTM